jgi:hypothetical protein
LRSTISFFNTQKFYVSLYLRRYFYNAHGRTRDDEVYKMCNPSSLITHGDYSRTNFSRWRAPASIQRLVICLIVARSYARVATLFWNLAFLSFHSSHATSTKRVSASFPFSLCHLCLHRSHQSRWSPPPPPPRPAPPPPPPTGTPQNGRGGGREGVVGGG